MSTSVAPKPTLSAKRKQWLEALAGKDPNSIGLRLAEMVWDSAAYRVVNEARRFAQPLDPDKPDGPVELNGLLHHLLDKCFFTSQMAAIRRLHDANSLEGSRGVFSLTSLLTDIIKYDHLLTRKEIFDAEEIEYDSAVIQAKLLEFEQQKSNAGETSYMIPRDLHDNSHHLRHMQIDQLTGVAPSDRKPSDQIPRALLESLKTKIFSSADRVKIYVDKFVAHAAVPVSRAGLDEAGLTLGYLWEAQRHMCEVASFVSHYLLGASQPSFMPYPQFGPFQFIERPLVDESHIPKLRRVLDEFREECDKWSRWMPDGVSGC